jgi:hypothetical protein
MLHKKLSRSTGALAGFASALSMFVGFLAARAAPHGLAKVSVALHLSRAPLIVKLAPIFAGIAAAIATAAGLITFYAWLVERDEPLAKRDGSALSENSAIRPLTAPTARKDS